MNGRVELCRRCGTHLDPVITAQGWNRHPSCYRECGDDHDLTRTLKALADAFPDARVYRDTKPEATAARADSAALGPCTRCGGQCIRYGDSGGAFCVSCRYLTVTS